MNRDDKEDNTIYKVVVNHEDSIPLPADQENLWAGGMRQERTKQNTWRTLRSGPT